MKKVLRDWALVIGMLAGIFGFLLLDAMHLPVEIRSGMMSAVSYIQPLLIFLMLFLTFCRISFAELKLKGWHLWLILIQGGLFTLLGLLLLIIPSSGWSILIEGAMLCLICPTATAGAVVTKKLGGSAEAITTYTVLVNLLAALLVPIIVPLVHPAPGMSVWTAGLKILSKVFPLLLLPLLSAYLLKHIAPRIRERLAAKAEWSFYLWIVALALALAVTTHSVVRSEVNIWIQIGLVAVSFATCIFQFAAGRKIGRRYGDAVTSGQSLGQKNTVFAIWMGYTFFTPVTALVGGFYSIWHNLINSYQLYHHYHPKDRKKL